MALLESNAFVEVNASMAAPLRGKKRWAYLERQKTMRLATTNEDGSIYLSSLWYVIRDETIFLPIDAAGKHGVNIKEKRSLAGIVDSGDEYATVAGVRILGSAIEVDDPALFEELQNLVFDKYFYEGHPYAEPYFQFGQTVGRKYYAIKPDKMIGWDCRETAAPQAVESRVLPDFVTDRRI
ncbi:MAG: pyridoxamine 5'-phosphate oxidase family protein [Gammaproteobacteria bacterium]|jgi:hypothetical protein